ncbi:MAG: hypothetical protein HS101_01550 [Planctomycetia bacterium]|jgi:hypothetical protein|nr:hypothetical protein [Planctomycetia bacterium]MCC7316824.1 hypothetical protein [Planctomycetota bacterium]
MTASSDQPGDHAHRGPDDGASAYPDSHLAKSGRLGTGSPKTKLLLSLVPLTVLALWFAYMWFVSGVIPAQEKYSSGAIKAEGYLKRENLGEYVRHGHWITYFENGAKSGEGSYDMGAKTGKWTYWDELGVQRTSPHPSDHEDADRAATTTHHQPPSD